MVSHSLPIRDGSVLARAEAIRRVLVEVEEHADVIRVGPRQCQSVKELIFHTQGGRPSRLRQRSLSESAETSPITCELPSPASSTIRARWKPARIPEARTQGHSLDLSLLRTFRRAVVSLPHCLEPGAVNSLLTRDTTRRSTIRCCRGRTTRKPRCTRSSQSWCRGWRMFRSPLS